MKRYTPIIAAGLILCAVLSSCEKETLSDITKFENLQNLPGSAQRRIAFNGLTPAEKAEFWKYSIKKNAAGLTIPQKNLLMEIHDKLSPSVYQKNSRENITFTTLLVPAWLKKAETLFPKDKIYDLFYFMEGEQIVKPANEVYQLDQVAIPVYSETAPDCLCNIGSAYTCRKKQITVGTSGTQITVNYGVCNYSSMAYVCDRDDYGCGYLGLWSCNGNNCIF